MEALASDVTSDASCHLLHVIFICIKYSHSWTHRAYLIISSVRADVGSINLSPQPLQPAEMDAARCFIAADGEPDAGEPVRDQNEHYDEQYEYSGAVLDVVIEFTSDSTES